jgi:NADH-quinone oxidoreductase subunit F
VAYIFLRWEYKLANRAAAEGHRRGLRQAGYLGQEHPRLRLQPRAVPARQRRPLHLRRGDGLLNALEGKRATRAPSRPFPQVSGLWGKPTIVNNVETLCNVPHIVNNGAEWFGT